MADNITEASGRDYLADKYPDVMSINTGGGGFADGFTDGEEVDLGEACAIACDADMRVLATGYSRETGPHIHAEEVMLARLARAPHTVVCTLEPCLHRASKPTGCAERLVAVGVQRVAYAVAEDDTFTRQSGLSYLRDHGVDLVRIPGFEGRVRAVNAPVYGG